MDDEEALAYAAGVLDGDGFFTIVRDRSYNPKDPYYRIKMGIKQLWPGQGLRSVASVLGGRVAFERRASGQRHIARWELYSGDARAALDHVAKYLLVKRRQADVLLETYQLLARTSAPTGRRRRQVEHNREVIQRLNRGGPRHVQPKVTANRSSHTTPNATNAGSSSIQSAYLAGIMDSDGTFKIERRRVKAMINPHHRIKIGAAQVAPSPAIDLLAETFGGTVRIRGDGRAGHRPMARWSLFDKSAVPALAALLPYLVIKAPQARLLLQLRERKARGKLGITEWTHKTRWQRPIKMRKRCYSAEQVREFEQLYQIVKALHNDSPPYELPKSNETESPPR